MTKLLFTPEETAEALGIGRSKVHELMRSETIESVRIGACRRIPAEALSAYIDELRATQPRPAA